MDNYTDDKQFMKIMNVKQINKFFEVDCQSQLHTSSKFTKVVSEFETANNTKVVSYGFCDLGFRLITKDGIYSFWSENDIDWVCYRSEMLVPL